MPTEILNHMSTILTSILTAVGTTLIIAYMKSRKRKLIEQVTAYDARIGIIDSIAMNSILSFVMAAMIADSGAHTEFKIFTAVLVGISIVFFIYAHLGFHKSFLLGVLQNKQTKWSLIIVALYIFGLWGLVIWSILASGGLGSGSTHFVPRVLLLLYCSNLFILRIYCKWRVTRNYKKIIVITISGNRHESMELLSFGNYIAIHEKEADKRIIIPSHQIKAIEYIYEKTTLADHIDGEY